MPQRPLKKTLYDMLHRRQAEVGLLGTGYAKDAVREAHIEISSVASEDAHSEGVRLHYRRFVEFDERLRPLKHLSNAGAESVYS
jgi:hypothetical protein